MRIAVIGAGLGGLSAASYLRRDGYEVTVFDSADRVGGRSGLFASNGFSIDTGPSVLTMLNLLSDVFNANGANLSDELELIKLDPMYRANFEDEAGPSGGGVISVRAGQEAMRQEIRSVAGSKDAAAFDRFCAYLRKLYALEVENFIDRNFDSPLDFLNPLMPGLRLIQMGAFGRLAPLVERYFDDPRLQKLFSFQSLYAGLSPYDALAVYAVITYMDTIEGVYFPKGGMSAIPQALAKVAKANGVEFRLNSKVSRILRSMGSRGSVVGIELEDGERFSADAVVANGELPGVYRDLLGGEQAPRVSRKGEYSPSALLLLMGIDGKPSVEHAHHNIYFGKKWKESFDSLLKSGTRMESPSILVTIPTHSDPTLAPDGSSIVYALEPVPNLDGKIDWRYERDIAISDFKARLAHRGILGAGTSNIVLEKALDPLDWQAMGMERGTPFSLSHRFFQTGPFRPNNYDKRIPGLYFVGSSTVPGVGVPMVLISGKLVAQRIGKATRW